MKLSEKAAFLFSELYLFCSENFGPENRGADYPTVLSFSECRAQMDLRDFGQTGGRKRKAGSSPQCAPQKRQVVDPGKVQVEVVCDRYTVGAKWVYS